MDIRIPTKFTDKYINERIATLDKTISSCNKKIPRLTIEVELANQNHTKAINDHQNAINQYHQSLHPTVGHNPEYMFRFYTERMAEYSKRFGDAIEDLRRCEQRKKDCEIEKRNLKALLLKTEEQRAEEHYQLLLKTKNGLPTVKEDPSCLYRKANKDVSSEEKYRRLTKQFRDMEGYKNSAELAIDCDNQYQILKKWRKKQEQAEAQQRIEQTLAEKRRLSAIAEEQQRIHTEEELAEKQQRAKQQALAAQEQAHHKKEAARKKWNRIIIGSMLGGITGGIAFALFSIYTPNNIASDTLMSIVVSFAIAGGILGVIWAIAEYESGCGGGCLGIIIGTGSSFLLAFLFSKASTIVSVCVGVVLGALIGGLIGSKPPDPPTRPTLDDGEDWVDSARWNYD